MRHEGDALKISVETRNEKGRLGAARVELAGEEETSNVQRTAAEGAA